MLSTDIQYLHRLAPTLQRFNCRGNNVFNFRCPFCGDSKKNKAKTRGYCFPRNDKKHLLYHCHNCDKKGVPFGMFLSQLDQQLYRQYKLELFRETNNKKNNNPPTDKSKPEQPIKTQKTILLDFLFDSVASLGPDHVSWKYCQGRKIPQTYYNDIYFLPKTSLLNDIGDKYADKFTNRNEKRIGFPIYSRDKKLLAITFRSIEPIENQHKYILVRTKNFDVEKQPLIFNLDKIDLNKLVYVVEGPIDSLFLPNCIAVNTSDLSKAKLIANNKVLIFDNQPRNKQVCAQIRKAIKNNFNVFIWPNGFVEKDINDLILAGWTESNIVDLINKNTYHGLKALLRFNEWNKSAE